MKAAAPRPAERPADLAVSDAGIALIKRYEGLELRAYPDPAILRPASLDDRLWPHRWCPAW